MKIITREPTQLSDTVYWKHARERFLYKLEDFIKTRGKDGRKLICGISQTKFAHEMLKQFTWKDFELAFIQARSGNPLRLNEILGHLDVIKGKAEYGF